MLVSDRRTRLIQNVSVLRRFSLVFKVVDGDDDEGVDNYSNRKRKPIWLVKTFLFILLVSNNYNFMFYIQGRGRGNLTPSEMGTDIYFPTRQGSVLGR